MEVKSARRHRYHSNGHPSKPYIAPYAQRRAVVLVRLKEILLDGLRHSEEVVKLDLVVQNRDMVAQPKVDDLLYRCYRVKIFLLDP